MHVINAMFSRGLGGIEQASVDYCKALKLKGCKVTAIICPKAAVKPALLAVGVNIVEVDNLGSWDFFAKSYLKKVLGQLQPDAVIVHGNRALRLLKAPCKAVRTKLIGVTHNYSIRHMIGLDAVLTITEDLQKAVIAAGQPSERVYVIPNMVDVPERALKPELFRQQLIIGAMGRLVKKKGFDVFIEAMKILRDRDVSFKALLAGEGEELKHLKRLVDKHELIYQVNLIGWVSNKEQFFESIDIFCLPSLHEPFGIVLLEAFSFAKPVITTDTEGPSEIAKHNDNAVIIPKGDAYALADAIMALQGNQARAHAIARQGYHTAQSYSVSGVGDRLIKMLNRVAPLVVG